MKKILLIEDDIVLRENTAELLEFSGYQVETASNGRAGVEVAKKYKPSIIVCDIMMPELDGYGVLELLSKQSDKTLEKGWILVLMIILPNHLMKKNS